MKKEIERCDPKWDFKPDKGPHRPEWSEDQREENRKKWGVPDKKWERWVNGIKWVDEWNTHLYNCGCQICDGLNRQLKKNSKNEKS